MNYLVESGLTIADFAMTRIIIPVTQLVLEAMLVGIERVRHWRYYVE